MISMRAYSKLSVIFLLIIQILSGCQSKDLMKNKEEEKTKVSLEHKIKKTAYTGYFQKEIQLAKYEPSQGTYLGAYVLANPEIEFDIKYFEEAVSKNMAIGLRHYQIGDPFPDQWLLECLANKKAPHIVITPENQASPYKKEDLEETAKKFKDTYGIPVFIEFYPGAKEYGDPADYIAYFQLAKEIFAHHAPNAALVWSMDMEDVYDSMIYYPGDDYVDWVGMSMYFPVYKDDLKYTVDVKEHLDYFYNMYKDKKPMMLSKLAVSHYSNKDHTFYLEKAEDIIEEIYSAIPKDYPRIKAINYIDINNIKTAPSNMGYDNFKVSTEPKMTAIYKKAIKGSHYLTNVEESKSQSSLQWTQMKMPIYEWNDTLYILEDTIKYDWDMAITDQMKASKEIIGASEYYNLEKVVKAIGYKFTRSKNAIRLYQ